MIEPKIGLEEKGCKARTSWVWLLMTWISVFACVGVGRVPGQQPAESNETHSTPSLGVTNTIEQIVLPGTELTHKTVDPDETPLIVRVVQSFPHGDAFRYDISYFGMTKGTYDLRDFLERKDGSTTDDLPSIPVTINSILEEGQIEPNQLEIGGLSRFGGYWQLVLVGGLVWMCVLLALMFVGRARKQIEQKVAERKKTLAELLKPSVEKAIAGTLPQEKYAELERLLFAFWQKRLKLEQLDPAVALNKIRAHEESGPLIRQIEIWLHQPPGSADSPDVAELLAPYQKFSAVELEEVTADVQTEGIAR